MLRNCIREEKNAMRTCLLILGIALCCTVAHAAGEDPVTVQAALRTATIYRSGATLTHNLSVTLHEGQNSFLVEGLSNGVDINSIQIGCEQKITILSVAYSGNYVKPATRTAIVRQLEDSLEQLKRENDRIDVLIKADNDLLELLKSNREIRGAQTGLSVAELTKMVDYYRSKNLEVQNDISQLEDKQQKLEERRKRIQAQLNEELLKGVHTTGKLDLQLYSATGITAKISISYFTGNARWVPAYDIRVEKTSQPISLSYKAKISQTTGIEWKQVRLTLATSMPNQTNTAPILNTWFLDYSNPVSRLENSLLMNSIQSNLQPKSAALQDVVVVGYAARDKEDDAQNIKIRGVNSINPGVPLYLVNGVPTDEAKFKQIDPQRIKKVEVLKQEAASQAYGLRAAGGVVLVTLKENLEDYITTKEGELSITYDIDLPYDIPSNGREQNIAFKETQAPVLFKFYSVPKLDNETYLLSELSEWEKLNLLPGEANIIFEGVYTGKTFLNPGSTQDTMNLAIGKDKRIVVKREKLKDFSSTKFLGSNKKQVFTYEITVKNNKNEAAQILLKDQYPISTNKEIEVELLESSEAANNKDLGVLSWNLQLAAGETKKMRISYSVKYPKDKYLGL